jgi:hypothetical protein
VSGLTRVLNRLGTKDSVSWPAFWLTLIAGIIGNFSAVQTGAPVETRLFIIVTAQIALFIPLVFMRVLFLRNAIRPKPVLVLVGFAVAVLTRAFTIIFLSRQFFPDDSTTVAARIIGNFLNIGLVLVVTAYVVSLMRERRRQIAQLENLRAELAESIDLVSLELNQRNEATVDRVREVLLVELNRLDSANPTGSLITLQDTAANVVRPMSHELATELPEVVMVPVEADPESTSWGAVLDRIVSGRPFRPVLTAAFMSLEAIAVLATLRGVLVAMVALPFVLAALLALANVIFERVSRRLRTLARLVLVLALSALAGAMLSAVIWVLIGGGPVAWALGIGGGVFAAGLAIGVSIGSGITRDRDRIIVELTESTRALERSLVRRKQTQWLQNKSLSRALHGPVQTAVNAAAYKLDGAMRDGRVSVEMIEGVRSELISSLDILSHGDGAVITVDQSINRIVAVWDGICDVNVSISQEVHDELDSDVITRSCFIDMITEAVSNAVRHGQATRVVITATFSEDDIHLDVGDNGPALFAPNAPGLGSALLDDCTTGWSLQFTGPGHLLKAVIPT